MNRRRLLQGAGALLSVCRVPPLFASSFTAEPPLAAGPLRQPDLVRAFLGDATDTLHPLQPGGNRWTAAGVELTYDVTAAGASASLTAPNAAVRRIQLRWNMPVDEKLLILGDAWERSYGDLAWSQLLPERPLPWYCLLSDGNATTGIGVETSAGAFAFWQVDPAGISLWFDTRNGGNGVSLGDRVLHLANIVTITSNAGETPYDATKRLCIKMAAKTIIPTSRGTHTLKAIYGSNDWYYAYGMNTADGILRDAALVRELAPAGPIRPFTIVDDGYQDAHRFPDMHRLADNIRRMEVNPGVWIRPLRAPTSTRSTWLLPTQRFGKRQDRYGELAYDPTVPEAFEAVLSVVREARGWGYDMIKHDFTTYELLGHWGNEMGASPTVDGWNLHDRSLTNAEIITALYKGIRSAAGDDRIVLGCNTVGHLSVGIFDASRTGDDVSGRDWERTRRMGVNTLAFRLPQNGIFFAIDADCVPITKAIPWKFTEQWLRAVVSSGTVLLISPEPGAIGSEQKKAIRAAFRDCVALTPHSEPRDWMANRTPDIWTDGTKAQHYHWLAPEGASPF